MRPSTDRKWCPKTENEKTTLSNSSSSTQNASNRITRAINKAVSTILPSSSDKQSLNSTNNNPPPGLSSILSRPSLTIHSNSSSKRATGFSSSSSQVRENQTSRPNPNHNHNPNSCVNPVLRTNLLTTTPTFSGVTSTQLTSNSKNKRVTCPTGPLLHNTSPTNSYYENKGKRVISTRFATNLFNPSQPVKSNSATQTYTSKSLLNPPNSRIKIPPVKGNPTLTGFSSAKSLSLKDGHKADTIPTNKSSVEVTITDPKGKGIVNVGEPSTAKKYPNLRRMESGNPSEKVLLNSNKQSTYKNYEDWLKNRFISASDRSCLIEPVPVGERCQLCSLDLAFLPFLSSSHSSLDPPVVVVLPCGHSLHEACLEHVFGSLEEPKCFACVTRDSRGI